MKKILVLLALASVLPAMAQDVSKMNPSGQSGPSEKARYVLGLVHNGYADRLNKYFENEPWQIQTEIDTYTDTNKTASIGIFCVAVDLGNLDVVKSFVENGIGPADLCRVQTFSTKKVVVSRAEALINTDTTHTKASSNNSSRSQGPVRSIGVTWFGAAYYSNKGSSSSSSSSHTDTTTTHKTEKYTNIHYGEKKVVKTYFANPLDFATGEVFDYLWEKGFRSPNLFTGQALADAKANGRTEVWQYIMDNKPEILGDKPAYISQETYDKLLETAKKDPNSLAYALLEKNVLGKVGTSAQAAAVQQAVQREMQTALAAGNDTTGYGAVNQEIVKTSSNLQQKEHTAAIQKAKHIQFVNQVKPLIQKNGNTLTIQNITTVSLTESGSGYERDWRASVYVYGDNTIQLVLESSGEERWKNEYIWDGSRYAHVKSDFYYSADSRKITKTFVNGKETKQSPKGLKTKVF